MKTKKIGIVRSIYYYNQHIFIKSFFEYQGYNLVISKYNSKEKILEQRCTIINKYLKQILYLKNKCDYVIIPYEKERRNDILCPFLSNIETITNNYIDKQIAYNIDKPITLLINSIQISKNIPKIIISYILAIHDYHKHQKRLINIQKEKANNTKEKILIINNQLSDNNIKSKYTVLYSEYLNEKLAEDYSNEYKEYIPIKHIRLSIGSIYYYHNLVSAIYILERIDCQYQIQRYLKYLEPKIKRKIKIINI